MNYMRLIRDVFVEVAGGCFGFILIYLCWKSPTASNVIMPLMEALGFEA